MDLRIAVWRLRPTSQYLLNTAGNAIVEWRDPTTTQPTPTELQAAWNAYQAEQQVAEQDQQAKKDEQTTATSDLQAEYDKAITRLDQIIAGGFANNTARDAAITDLARIMKRALRVVKAQVG